MPFGKFKGEEVSDLEQSYLEWLVSNVNLFGALKDEVEMVLSQSTDTNEIDDDEIDMIVIGDWPQ